ncbi:MAG: NAD(+) kinase [Gammaproteobacteria bacterium]|nr:NAD(+) kinase [Gammaproteobacteria bacterium]
MTIHFTRIGLIGKTNDRKVAFTLQALAQYLQQRQAEILLDTGIAHLLPDTGHRVVERAELGGLCDLAIVVGGDGTLLNTARSLAESDVAVLGVNLGRLGFLVDVSPEDMTQQLDCILGGEYIEEQRTLLHATMSRGDAVLSESTALNDVIVHKRDIARMIELDTWIDGRFLNTNRSDGLIVATPTGSTAYALSGGGPILTPRLNAIALVPICPHTLSNRPIVIDDDAVIEIILHEGTLEASVSCDGQVSQPLQAGDRVRIRKHDHSLRLLHPPGHDYFTVLREKLRWSEQP